MFDMDDIIIDTSMLGMITDVKLVQYANRP